jgi:hypothetical protein
MDLGMAPGCATAYIFGPLPGRFFLVARITSIKTVGSVRAKRVRNADGKSVRVLSLDANSKTFIDDLATVFRKNVAKARRENRQLLGSADGLRAGK